MEKPTNEKDLSIKGIAHNSLNRLDDHQRQDLRKLTKRLSIAFAAAVAIGAAATYGLSSSDQPSKDQLSSDQQQTAEKIKAAPPANFVKR